MLFHSVRVVKSITTNLKYYSQLVNLRNIEHINQLRDMALEKARQNPVILKLDSPDFHSLFTDELQSLASIFKEYGFEIRIAGGAVRDLLSGIKPKDLDFATTATPDQMKEMFTSENVRMINMNGEKHGTITPRINDKENFEVTTLRIDLLTNGRHAEVQFTTDWLLDSQRRDLTINSMFLGLDGSVYDYFYGYEDLKNCKLRFVGDPSTRIQEDYLRILRYFRFYGRIAKEPDSHDEECLAAIRDNKTGLGSISGERIWMELSRILEGNYGGDLLLKAIDCGLGSFIGLPNNSNVEELKLVWERTAELKPQAMTILASLLRDEKDVLELHSRLKLSAFDRDLGFFIVAHREPILSPQPLLHFQKLVVKSGSKNSYRFVEELLKYNAAPYLEQFQKWKLPKFPITGHILKEKGVPSGKQMGFIIKELQGIWADQGFDMPVDEILSHLPIVQDSLLRKKKNKS